MNRSIQTGFTLAELLATVGIGALLLSVGLPGLTTFAKNARQISVSNEFLADFHYARDLAITNNNRVTICPSSNGISCNGASWEDGRIVFVDNDGDRVVDADDVVQRITTDMGDVNVATTEFGAAITYRPNGRAMANTVRDNTGEFIICDDRGPDHARALIVDISGRPRISHENALGVTPTCPTI